MSLPAVSLPLAANVRSERRASDTDSEGGHSSEDGHRSGVNTVESDTDSREDNDSEDERVGLRSLRGRGAISDDTDSDDAHCGGQFSPVRSAPCP